MTKRQARRRRWAPTPRVRTKTITAARLLERIKQVVLAEPARVNMNAFLLALGGRVPDYGSHVSYRPGEGMILGAEPACGTVGCIAGWGAVLLRGPRTEPWILEDNAADVLGAALGYDNVIGRVGYLFAASRNLDEPPPGTPGTQQHAEFVAHRIDRYLARHPDLRRRVINVTAARRALSTGRIERGLYRERPLAKERSRR